MPVERLNQNLSGIKYYFYSNVKPRLKKASSFESQRRLTHVNVPVANHSSKCLYENHLHSDPGDRVQHTRSQLWCSAVRKAPRCRSGSRAFFAPRQSACRYALGRRTVAWMFRLLLCCFGEENIGEKQNG